MEARDSIQPAKLVVEGCPAIDRVTPLRQGYALPPPLAGEDDFIPRSCGEQAR
ncbi:hypothetical protein FB595_10349 [Sphingobium sp. AEW010]|nr:hypothetical protein [Sphingobium sp. JAI105]TWD10485.1 hypothetical protein FB595_10349 [Sphingobium sp. AEW010]TWD28110.1 hypothetical protein FB596_103266 [Sphingobium sp. AEW013]TWD28819.1 hypothetical protein FB594_10349 [Sphingobium sp. AEW001]